MKVVRIHSYGGPEVLKLEELPLPEPEPMQVLVKVAAAGVNYFDIFVRSAPHESHFYPSGLPLELGIEGAGTVQAVGSGVEHVRVGDRVAWGGNSGAYATHALVPVFLIIPLPDSISLQQAAAILNQGLMAHALCRSVYPLKAGDTCLIHTIAGGVGLLLCQMAKICGARVIGTTSTDEKANIAYTFGADSVIVYKRDDFEEKVKSYTEGKGVNVIYDAIGLDTYEKDLNCLAERGYLVFYGQMSGAVPLIDTMALAEKGSLFLTRATAVHYLHPQEIPGRLQELFHWIEEGALQAKVTTYALEDVVQAHEALEQRHSIGKILLIPEL